MSFLAFAAAFNIVSASSPMVPTLPTNAPLPLLSVLSSASTLLIFSIAAGISFISPEVTALTTSSISCCAVSITNPSTSSAVTPFFFIISGEYIFDTSLKTTSGSFCDKEFLNVEIALFATVSNLSLPNVSTTLANLILFGPLRPISSVAYVVPPIVNGSLFIIFCLAVSKSDLLTSSEASASTPTIFSNCSTSVWASLEFVAETIFSNCPEDKALSCDARSRIALTSAGVFANCISLA